MTGARTPLPPLPSRRRATVATTTEPHLLLRICAVALMLAAVAGCPAGQYYSGASGCTSCGVGRFSTGDKGNKPEQCTQCEAGRHCSSQGAQSATACEKCPFAKQSGRGSGSCAFCGPGKHSTFISCKKCDKGKFSSDGKGCNDCHAGQFSAEGESSCHPCAKGQHSSTGHAACADCVAGKFSGGTPGDICQDCDVGQASNDKAGQCTPCLSGHYADAKGKVQCTECAAGQYADHVGATSCQVCPHNSTTPGVTGRTSVTACKCNPGYTGIISTSADTCEACEKGKSKAGYTPGAPCLECAVGQYQDEDHQLSCKPCGDRNGCECANTTNKWPTGAGPTGAEGICRQGTACHDSPGHSCINGATCIPLRDSKAHTCDCHDKDLFGLRCERTCAQFEDQAGPLDGWCANAGRCIYDPDTTNERSYLCSCEAGWSGTHCEIMDPCIVLNPCANGATCNVTITQDGYTCHCPTGFSGKNCDILTSEWSTSTSDWGLLILGSLAVACYFGLYWHILRNLRTGNPQIVRILLSTGVTLMALIIVCCIVGAVRGQRGACDGDHPSPTPAPHPQPGPQLTLESAPAPGAPCCGEDQRNGCNPDPVCSPPRTCDRSHGAHGSWNGTACECDHGYSGSVCHIGLSGRQCCNTCCPQHQFTPHAASGDGCYCWNPEPGQSKTCDTGCDDQSDREVVDLSPTRALHVQSSASNATPAPVPLLPTPPLNQLSDCLVQTVDDDLKVYGAALGSTVLQGIIAFCLHWSVRDWFPNFATESVSRLRRGTGLPLLVLCSAIPSIAIGGVWANPDGLSSAGVDMMVDEFVIYTWHPINFVVLFPSLFVAAVLAHVYLRETERERGDCVKFLRENGVPHPNRFLRAEKSFAALSGLLFPFFWISYLVNEQQEFLSFARVGAGYSTRLEFPEMRYTRDNGEFASVDGVRALMPVVCALNFVAAGWGGYMIYAFPAPLVWTPSMFFGVVWCAACSVLLVVISLVLIWSLSESKELADNRYKEVVFGYGMHGYIPEAVMDAATGSWTFAEPTRCDRLKEYLCCARNFCGSWTGQTLISGVNHLAAIVLFCYGLHHFHGEHIIQSGSRVEILTPAIKKYLWVGIGLTVLGFTTSMASLFQRRKPRCKCTPTDDSFRLACVLKALLVMTKALVVYELSKIDMTSNEDLEWWYHLVFYVCCVSVFILAILTCAVDVFKVRRDPRLIEEAGFANGSKFLRMYLFSFLNCKLAIFFFVMLGHIPDWMGCDSELQKFHGKRGMAASIDCTVCYRKNQHNDSRCDDNAEAVYYACTTTCSKLFFSGAGEMPVSLDVFVLVPLIWLPFAVYSNNEVARMIDGIWQRKRNRDQQRSGSAVKDASIHSAARVGLSSTGHGYNAIVNFSHTVVLLCCAIMVYFLAKAGGSYRVGAPAGLERIQKPLHDAGALVTGCVIALNGLMVSRFLYEKTISCGREPQRGPTSALLQEPLSVLGGGGAAPQRHTRASQQSLCMYGCGRCVAPGRRQDNGDPYDSCCRACAVAGGSPVAHDPECEHRLPRF